MAKEGGAYRDLERILPNVIKKGGTWSGNEIVLPYSEALQAIAFANEHQIAILGLEGFEITKDGLLTVDMADASGYVKFRGDWEAYVAAVNAESEHWIRQHPLGENHGYILTSASQKEFALFKIPKSLQE